VREAASMAAAWHCGGDGAGPALTLTALPLPPLPAILPSSPLLPTSPLPSLACCSTAQLEVRDITSRPEWEQRYAMTIPVLAAAQADGSGEVRGGVVARWRGRRGRLGAQSESRVVQGAGCRVPQCGWRRPAMRCSPTVAAFSPCAPAGGGASPLAALHCRCAAGAHREAPGEAAAAVMAGSDAAAIMQRHAAVAAAVCAAAK
jgi:hypothetical protein